MPNPNHVLIANQLNAARLHGEKGMYGVVHTATSSTVIWAAAVYGKTRTVDVPIAEELLAADGGLRSDVAVKVHDHTKLRIAKLFKRWTYEHLNPPNQKA